jgi:hypothetical protein
MFRTTTPVVQAYEMPSVNSPGEQAHIEQNLDVNVTATKTIFSKERRRPKTQPHVIAKAEFPY